MKTILRSILIGTTAILLASVASYGRIVHLHASIDGSQENPPTTSPATGTATMQYNTETNTFDLTVNLHNFDEALSNSHIHRGYSGENGGVIVGLGGESAYKRGNKNLVLKVKGADFSANPEDITRLLSGGAYLNFHTPTFPPGAVRGQLIPDRIEFMAVADGTQEVPPTGSTATGVALATYYPKKNTIDVSITLMGFDNTLRASHVHEAPVGVNGPVKVGLGSENDGTYTRTGSTLEAELKNLPYEGNPVELMKGNAYLNFHSNVVPSGEIRGQLEVAD